MNLFDLFPEIEVETPSVPEKKTSAKKAENKTDAKNIKNKVSLPCKLYIQYHSCIEITKELLNTDDDSAANNQIEEYVKKNYLITKHMNFTYYNNKAFASFSLSEIKDKLKIDGKSVFFFNCCELSLSDYEGEIDCDTLLGIINENGFSLPKDTGFALKGNYILPVFKSVSSEQIKSSLLSPVKISIIGLPDMELTTDNSITEDLIKERITDEYPDLKGKITLCCLNAAQNTIEAFYSDLNTTEAGKKNETFKVTENTTIKLFSNVLEHNVSPGEYTHKELCKQLSLLVPECNTPDSIFIKEFKKENLIILGIKFGGSKGGFNG